VKIIGFRFYRVMHLPNKKIEDFKSSHANANILTTHLMHDLGRH
jgi:hypothetical protein